MIACALLGLGMAIGLPIMEIDEVRGLLAATALWQRGTEAADTGVDGHETSHNFILNSYKLDVEYVDQAGQQHNGKVEFNSLFASVDQKSPAIVKYDPQAPERFALSWMVDMKGLIWAAVAFMSSIGLAIGVAMMFGTYQLSRKLTAARRAAVEAEESSVALVKVIEMRQSGRATGVMKYQHNTTDAAGKTQGAGGAVQREEAAGPPLRRRGALEDVRAAAAGRTSRWCCATTFIRSRCPSTTARRCWRGSSDGDDPEYQS